MVVTARTRAMRAVAVATLALGAGVVGLGVLSGTASAACPILQLNCEATTTLPTTDPPVTDPPVTDPTPVTDAPTTTAKRSTKTTTTRSTTTTEPATTTTNKYVSPGVNPGDTIPGVGVPADTIAAPAANQDKTGMIVALVVAGLLVIALLLSLLTWRFWRNTRPRVA